MFLIGDESFSPFLVIPISLSSFHTYHVNCSEIRWNCNLHILKVLHRHSLPILKVLAHKFGKYYIMMIMFLTFEGWGTEFRGWFYGKTWDGRIVVWWRSRMFRCLEHLEVQKHLTSFEHWHSIVSTMKSLAQSNSWRRKETLTYHRRPYWAGQEAWFFFAGCCRRKDSLTDSTRAHLQNVRTIIWPVDCKCSSHTFKKDLFKWTNF